MEADGVDRCTLCILPRSARLIDFDGDGMCRLCRSAGQSATTRGDAARDEGEVESLIEKIRLRGQGRPFDCVVGVSGGRDSSYLLYLLVRKHQLRCLAVYYRTPFTSDVIDANVRRLTRRLGVPLVEMDISQESHRRVARELVLLWAEDRQPITANLTCAPCKWVNREIFRVAAKNKVPTIVAGANVFEAVQIAAGQPSDTTIIPGQEAAGQLSLRMQIKKMVLVLKRGINVLGTSRGLWRYIPLGVQASVLYISPHTPFLRLRYRKIQAVEYFYHANWDEAHCQDALEEMGWELPLGYHSTWKADCTFAELKNRMFHQMMGMTYMDAFFSNMVRAGIVSRDEALQRIEAEGQVSQVRLEDACRVLDLPDGFCAS
jgi:hypothetical protein